MSSPFLGNNQIDIFIHYLGRLIDVSFLSLSPHPPPPQLLNCGEGTVPCGRESGKKVEGNSPKLSPGPEEDTEDPERPTQLGFEVY